MIQVRDVLQVKFGKIDQAVELFTHIPLPRPRYMDVEDHFNMLTDISGSMYTLVNEFTVASLGEWERERDQIFAQPNYDAWFKQFQLFVEGGRREYYTIEGKYGSWSRPGVIVVREQYRARKWQIQTAVSLLERYGALLEDRGVGRNSRITTDASGPMFQAVIEVETDNMAKWENDRRNMFRQPEFEVWFVQLLAVVESGAHEFFKVEYTGA
jgi:hypothetical protein